MQVKNLLVGMTATAVVTLFGGASAFGAEVVINWTGGGLDNKWSTAGNWQGNNVPDNANEVAHFDEDATVTVDMSPTIGSLRLSGSGVMSSSLRTPLRGH